MFPLFFNSLIIVIFPTLFSILMMFILNNDKDILSVFALIKKEEIEDILSDIKEFKKSCLSDFLMNSAQKDNLKNGGFGRRLRDELNRERDEDQADHQNFISKNKLEYLEKSRLSKRMPSTQFELNRAENKSTQKKKLKFEIGSSSGEF